MALLRTNRSLLLGGAAVLILLAGLALWPVLHPARREVLYLAVAGPLGGEQGGEDQEMLRGIRLYLEQVNRAGGVDGRQVELLCFDDGNDPELAEARAREIAAGNALAVIGHLYSSTSVRAGVVYHQAGVPAITAGATAEAVTADNDWYFRATFTNRSQAMFLANYVQRILGYNRASIIYEADEYGLSLARPFENTFRGLGGEIGHTWSYTRDESSGDLDAQLRAIVADLLRVQEEDPGIILLATQAEEGAKLTVLMRRKGLDYPLVGGDSVGDVTFGALFNAYAEERAQPGYFSDGIYAASPLIFDIASEAVQRFRETYLERYGQEPGWTAVAHYDAAAVAVQALRAAGVYGRPDTRAEDRQRVRDALAGMDSPAGAVDGIAGQIYFDRHGDAVWPVMMGVFDHQHFISAMTQLQPVEDVDQVLDLERELAEGRILIVGGRYMYRTDVVYTGIDPNEISNLDTADSTYTADFYLWFRHQGDLDDTRIEFTNAEGSIKLGAPLVDRTADGLTYRVYRVKGDFRGSFHFRDYPFDEQDLAVRFRHMDLTRENLIYVQDIVGLRQASNQDTIERFERAQVLGAMQDWEMRSVHSYSDLVQSESTLGNPQFFDAHVNIAYSRFNMIVRLKRDGIAFSIKNLYPLFIITVISYMAFFVPPKMLAVSNGLLRGSLLAVAFFHQRLASALPGIDYTVALDYAFYVFYVLIVFACLVTLGMTRADEKGNRLLLRRLELLGQIIYPAMTVVGVIVMVCRYDLIVLARGQAPGSTASVTLPTAAVAPTDPLNGEQGDGAQVVLTLGSWRPDDEEQMARILAAFHEDYPQIDVRYEPVNAVQYNTILRSQLEHGVAPDLFYLRSFSISRQLFEAGYLEPLDNLPGLQEQFAPAALAPWSGAGGEPYGVPFIAVAHGIYYNADLLAELGLEPPSTWEGLLDVARQIAAAGYIPFANASGDPWTAAEIVFMNIAPNFIGGSEGRLAYLSGDRCFNDPHAAAAFQAVADLAPFLPPNESTVCYYDSQQLFLQGRAAMWLGGSWDIPVLNEAAPAFHWGVLAVPAPAGEQTYLTFHPDAGVGLNAASSHPAEARLFLQWLARPETGELLGNELPGFFPLHTTVPVLQDPHARAFVALSQEYGTDVRWAWPILGEGMPDGYTLMQAGAVGVMRGQMTPQEAADQLQYGLAQWFEPAQTCRR